MNINLENKAMEKGSYRNLKGLNYSSIKLFDADPVRFYKEFILGEKHEQKTTYSLTIGDLVDFYLLECKGNEEEFIIKFDEKFAMFEGNKTTAQAFLLADELFTLTKRDIVDGEITTSFEIRFKEAFNNLQKQDKYKGKPWEKGLEDFNKTSKDYFDKLLENINKKVVSLQDVEKAKSIVHNLMNDEFTSHIFRNPSLLAKQVLEFKYKGMDCKSEVDFMTIDHDKQIIQPYDLKTTYDNEEFDYNYLKHGYYLQQAFYSIGLQEMYPDYSILPFNFIVADTSSNNRRPLIYDLSADHYIQGRYGFTYNNYKYRGVDELIDEIVWADENSIWNINKNNYMNRGIVKLKMY